MTMTISNHTSSRKARSFFGLLFARQPQYPAAPRHKTLLAAAGEWLARRRAAAELHRLSDRELSDIGVSRQQIPELLRRGRRG